MPHGGDGEGGVKNKQGGSEWLALSFDCVSLHDSPDDCVSVHDSPDAPRLCANPPCVAGEDELGKKGMHTRLQVGVQRSWSGRCRCRASGGDELLTRSGAELVMEVEVRLGWRWRSG